MNDADALGRALRNAAHAGKSDRMVAAEHQRQRARREHMGDAPGYLVEALLQISRDREYVAGIAQRHLLAQVDAELVVVRRVERRDAANALRSEASPGPIGRAGIERDADQRRIILADVAHILHIGRLQKGVDAGKMRQLSACKGRYRLVRQAFGAGQAHVERPLLFPAPTRFRQLPLRLGGFPALGCQPIEISMMAPVASRSADETCLARTTYVLIKHSVGAPWSCLARHSGPVAWKTAESGPGRRGSDRDRKSRSLHSGRARADQAAGDRVQ